MVRETTFRRCRVLNHLGNKMIVLIRLLDDVHQVDAKRFHSVALKEERAMHLHHVP
jgi:hypothetical protein